MITDEMIAEAALELNTAMLKDLPDSDCCSHKFSAGFEKKMNRLIRKAKHPRLYTFAQRAACILLVLILGFMALLAVSPTARAGVLGWIKKQYETVTSYSFVGDPATYEPTVFYIASMPEGYTEIIFDEGARRVVHIYANEDGNWLNFSYTTTPEETVYSLAVEGYRVEKVSVHNHSGELYLSDDPARSNSLIWLDKESQVIFCLSGFFDKEELIQIGESVTAEIKK